MLNLIANENMKIYRRIRTWIMVAILILATAAVTPVFKMGMGIDGGHYSMWSSVKDLSALLQLVTLLAVVVAADMVAGEFSWGTIKTLLVRPVSRTKILLSKYLATALFALFLMTVLFVGAIVFSGLWAGFEGFGGSTLSIAPDGAVAQEGSTLASVLLTYVLRAVELLMVVTIAFMISTVFRSSSLAIGFSIFMLFAGQMIADLLLSKVSWGKFFLFANTDLTSLVEGTPRFAGMTFTFSISVLVVYFIIINLITWLVFNRRDVAA